MNREIIAEEEQIDANYEQDALLSVVQEHCGISKPVSPRYLYSVLCALDDSLKQQL